MGNYTSVKPSLRKKLLNPRSSPSRQPISSDRKEARRAFVRKVLREQFDALDTLARKGRPEHETRWHYIAEAMGWSTFTIQHWVRMRGVPKDKVRLLRFEYGTHVDIGKLAGET